jgi:hypothetical protein
VRLLLVLQVLLHSLLELEQMPTLERQLKLVSFSMYFS